MPAIRGGDSKKKTRRYTRDLDQIHEDLKSPRHLELYHETKEPTDLPALGEHYCIPCAKWFESEHNFMVHKKAKPHKRRLRQLKEEPYSQKEAELGAGLTTNKGRQTEEMVIDEEIPDASAAMVMDPDPAACLVEPEPQQMGAEAIE